MPHVIYFLPGFAVAFLTLQSQNVHEVSARRDPLYHEWPSLLRRRCMMVLFINIYIMAWHADDVAPGRLSRRGALPPRRQQGTITITYTFTISPLRIACVRVCVCVWRAPSVKGRSPVLRALRFGERVGAIARTLAS